MKGGWGNGFLRIIGKFFDLVVLEPIRNGRLAISQWSMGLRWLGGAALFAYIAASLGVIFADQIRSSDALLQGEVGTLPQGLIAVFWVFNMFSLILVQTAVLHGHVLFRIAALLVVSMVFGMSTLSSGQLWVVVCSLAALIGLVVLHLARIGRKFSPWEFFWVTLLVLLGTQLSAFRGVTARNFGYDMRLGQLETFQLTAGALAWPAFLVAGIALTQLAVTAGESAGAIVRDTAPRTVIWVLLAGLLGWVGFSALRAMTGDGLVDAELTGALQTLSLGAIIAIPIAVRAHRYRRLQAPGPGDLAEIFAPLSFAVAAAYVWSPLILRTLSIFSPILKQIGLDAAANVLDRFDVLSHPIASAVARLVVSLVAVIWAWHRARRGDWISGVLMGLLLARSLISILRVPFAAKAWLKELTFTSAGTGVVLFGLTVWALVHVVLTGRATRYRLGCILMAVAIQALYNYRDILEDPFSYLLGFSAVAVLLFGLFWRLLTDGEFTRADTKAAPQSLRVLAFLANSLFAVTNLAFVALSRTQGSSLDVTQWQELGDSDFAPPLFIGAVLITLLMAVFPENLPSAIEDTDSAISPSVDPHPTAVRATH